MRNADGWMAELVTDEHGTRLLDHHSPLAEVARLYQTSGRWSLGR
ncbi:hypothetical protein [Verrucomicrobium spinosum]|nr:hypothetical protein [Verrucomicrobium spinosum]